MIFVIRAKTRKETGCSLQYRIVVSDTTRSGEDEATSTLGLGRRNEVADSSYLPSFPDIVLVGAVHQILRSMGSRSSLSPRNSNEVPSTNSIVKEQSQAGAPVRG